MRPATDFNRQELGRNFRRLVLAREAGCGYDRADQSDQENNFYRRLQCGIESPSGPERHKAACV